MESSKDPNNVMFRSTHPKILLLPTEEVENESFNEESASDSSPKKRKILVSEEAHISHLFDEALDFIKKTMKVSDDELEKGMYTVIESFQYQKGNQFSDIDFDMSENLCAYFYRYSILSAELSRSKISEAISNCGVLQSCLSRPKINVVSVGGGPGCDIVGMCSALSLYKNIDCKKIKFTVVDSAKRWKSFLNIVEFLMLEGDFGDASTMFKKTNANISFICEDVCNANTQRSTYDEALNNADILLMKSLLSIIPIGSRYSLAENVATRMKVDAVLLFIDAPMDLSSEFGDFGLKKIYSSEIERDLPISPEKANQFWVKGSPSKNYGARISRSSKAEIAVFVKENN